MANPKFTIRCVGVFLISVGIVPPFILSWDKDFNDGCYWNELQNVTNISTIDKRDALAKMLRHLKPENNFEMVVRYMTKYMPYMDDGTLFLELKSGDGEFIFNLAKNLSHTGLRFLPSETNQTSLSTISNKRENLQLSNVLEPILLDPCSDPQDWFANAAEKVDNFSLAYVFNANSINLMHWNCTKQIFRAAQQYLKSNGSMFFYGTFSYGTVRSPKANKDLHNLMKMINPDWGLRDAYREMTKFGAMVELYLDRSIFYPTPLYSELLVWKRMHDELSRKAEKVYQKNIREY